MKSVLISIQPKWNELIASGKKTVEVRKTKPKLETPFRCYIYCTKDNSFAEKTLRGFDENGKAIYYKANKGKVIGEFVCRRISGGAGEYAVYHTEGTCLTPTEIADYIGDTYAYYWHISDLVIYDKPRELSEFLIDCKCCSKIFVGDPNCWQGCVNGYRRLTRPPQSWCYVESEDKE